MLAPPPLPLAFPRKGPLTHTHRRLARESCPRPTPPPPPGATPSGTVGLYTIVGDHCDVWGMGLARRRRLQPFRICPRTLRRAAPAGTAGAAVPAVQQWPGGGCNSATVRPPLGAAAMHRQVHDLLHIPLPHPLTRRCWDAGHCVSRGLPVSLAKSNPTLVSACDLTRIRPLHLNLLSCRGSPQIKSRWMVMPCRSCVK